VAVLTGSDAVAAQVPRRSLRGSWELFRAFRAEQSDPDRFYGALAADSARQVLGYAPLSGRLVLDVGGGPGYFQQAFEAQGARYVAVDADLGEMSALGSPRPGQVLGDGTSLPVRSDSVDVCFSSNVLEHVADPVRMAQEMLRVTRPGGVVFVSYTLWWSPWGGHETAPWHYLGGAYAARRYRRVHGHGPKNEYGRTLFPLRASTMLAWARTQTQAELVDALPRYHPWWAAWTVRVPGLRELVVWNLVLVLRKQ
jgi:SAM-dependent methyltransferase